jgi:hypothetical protein
VDGIPFKLPVECAPSPVITAAFSIDAKKAQEFLPGNELFVLRWLDKALLLLNVINYQDTTIGKYIEFSVGIACTRVSGGKELLVSSLLTGKFDIGQYVLDLPVSTEISVKGGRGIWGMPKCQANLSFEVDDQFARAQYEKDNKLALALEINRSSLLDVPLSMSIDGYAAFRGMLFKSTLYFEGKAAVSFQSAGKARLVVGDHPRVQALKTLGISSDPVFTAYLPAAKGVLDDHCETWFLNYEQVPAEKPEGMEAVVKLGLSEAWLPPPSIPVDFKSKQAAASND